MKDASPLGENWIRLAVDVIVETEKSAGRSLPSEELESFLFDVANSPRARRIAFEILVSEEPNAKEECLDRLADDPSLELRYDAVRQILDRANAIEDHTEKLTYLERALNSARDVEQLKACAKALGDLGKPIDLSTAHGFRDDLAVDWSV